MANDLQAEITTKLGQTLSSIKQLTSEVKQLHAATANNNRSHDEFQKKATDAFKGARKEANEFKEELHHGTHALAMMHGPLGEVAERMAGIARLAKTGGGMMAMLGVAAVGAGVAFELIAHYMEEAKERTENAEKAARSYNDAIQKGREEANRGAIEGVSGANTYRKLHGTAGAAGVEEADKLADSLGIPVDEARRLVLSSHQQFKDPGQRKTAMDAMTMLYKSGQGDLDPGMFKEMRHSGILRGMIERGDDLGAAGAMAAHGQTGHFRTTDDYKNRVWYGMHNNDGDSLLGAASDVSRGQNKIEGFHEDEARNGDAARAIGTAVERALHPTATAIKDAVVALMREAMQEQDPKKRTAKLLAIGEMFSNNAMTSGEGN